jgi:hypothetical protein
MTQQNNSGSNPTKRKPSSGSSSSSSTTSSGADQQAGASVTEQDDMPIGPLSPETKECYSRMMEVLARQRAQDKET